MGDVGNVCNISVGNPDRKRSLRTEVPVNKGWGGQCELDSSVEEQWPMADACQCYSDRGEVLEQPGDR